MSPRRRGLILGLIAVIVVAVVAVVVRVILDRPSVTVDRSRPGPVILVPGYGGSRDALNVLAGRLGASGRTAVVLTLPGDGDGDLVGQADALDDLVGQQLAGGAPSVDLIGYSAGGVVVRLFVDRYDNAKAARRVVTLGAPLHGAAVAGVGAAVVPGACPTACQQLAPGSSLLAQLQAAALPSDLPWLSLYSATDETVEPASSRLAGAVNVELQSICPGATVPHGQLPVDPLPTGLVRRDLDGAQPLTAPPGPADCSALRTQGT